MIKKIYLLVLFLGIVMTVSAEEQKKGEIYYQLDNRIKALERNEAALIKDDKVREKAQEVQFKSLKAELKEEYSLLTLVIYILFPISVIGAIVAVVTTYGRIKKNAVEVAEKITKEKIEEQYEKVLNENKATLLAIMSEQNEEMQLRQNKKILVLSAENGSDDFLKGFFTGMGFDKRNVVFRKVSQYQPENGHYDVIFANNETDDLSFGIINQYFDSSEENITALFYFNTTRKNYINSKVAERLNFANGRTQIYGNLINLLKYQDKLLS